MVELSVVQSSPLRASVWTGLACGMRDRATQNGITEAMNADLRETGTPEAQMVSHTERIQFCGRKVRWKENGQHEEGARCIRITA